MLKSYCKKLFTPTITTIAVALSSNLSANAKPGINYRVVIYQDGESQVIETKHVSPHPNIIRQREAILNRRLNRSINRTTNLPDNSDDTELDPYMEEDYCSDEVVYYEGCYHW